MACIWSRWITADPASPATVKACFWRLFGPSLRIESAQGPVIYRKQILAFALTEKFLRVKLSRINLGDMIKLVFCLHRLPHLSVEEFQDHWRKKHAPLIAHHARTLGIVHYVQSYAMSGPVSDRIRQRRSGPEPFDGIAEVWLESEDAIGLPYRDPAAAAAADAILEDERRFIDHARSPAWYCVENEVIA